MHRKGRFYDGWINQEQNLIAVRPAKCNPKIKRNPQIAGSNRKYLQRGWVISPEIPIILGWKHKISHRIAQGNLSQFRQATVNWTTIVQGKNNKLVSPESKILGKGPRPKEKLDQFN